jgi:hypothetical protein
MDKYWKRLILCGKIIRETGEISRLGLARELTNKGIPTTPWTIDKIRDDIEEMYDDIKYQKKIFYIIDNLSLSLLKKEKLE